MPKSKASKREEPQAEAVPVAKEGRGHERGEQRPEPRDALGEESPFEKILAVLAAVVRAVYIAALWTMQKWVFVVGYLFYPCKERFFAAAEGLDQYMNPYLNANSHDI